MAAAPSPLREIVRLPTPAGPVVIEATDAPGFAAGATGIHDGAVGPFVVVGLRLSAGRACRRPVVVARLEPDAADDAGGALAARPLALLGHRGALVSGARSSVFIGVPPGTAERVLTRADGVRLVVRPLDRGEAVDVAVAVWTPDAALVAPAPPRRRGLARWRSGPPDARTSVDPPAPSAPWRELARVETPRGPVVVEGSAPTGLVLTTSATAPRIAPLEPGGAVDAAIRVDVVAEARSDVPAHAVRAVLRGVRTTDPAGAVDPGVAVIMGAETAVAIAAQDAEAIAEVPDRLFWEYAAVGPWPALRQVPGGVEAVQAPLREGEVLRSAIAVVHVGTARGHDAAASAAWFAAHDAVRTWGW